MRSKFVYLAVVLDAWSRKVVGWALGRTLAAKLAVDALGSAIAERQQQPRTKLQLAVIALPA